MQLFAGKAASGTSGSAVSTTGGSGSGAGTKMDVVPGGVWGLVAGIGLGVVGLVSVGLL